MSYFYDGLISAAVLCGRSVIRKDNKLCEVALENDDDDDDDVQKDQAKKEKVTHEEW